MYYLFLACEPLVSKRVDKDTEHHTSQGWAYFLREVVEVHYTTAEKFLLEMDHLSTPFPACTGYLVRPFLKMGRQQLFLIVLGYNFLHA
jgi:hypothetical protein